MRRRKAAVLVVAALMAAMTVFPATANAHTGEVDDGGLIIWTD